MTLDEIDRTGLIREAYAIDGITGAECRSILIDWALKLPGTIAYREAIEHLLAHHGGGREDHPMTAVLRAGLAEAAPPRRRGGRSGRLGGT